MKTRQHDGSDDPATVIGLIYRVLDERRRAITLLIVLLPVVIVSVVLVVALR